MLSFENSRHTNHGCVMYQFIIIRHFKVPCKPRQCCPKLVYGRHKPGFSVSQNDLVLQAPGDFFETRVSIHNQYFASRLLCCCIIYCGPLVFLDTCAVIVFLAGREYVRACFCFVYYHKIVVLELIM